MVNEAAHLAQVVRHIAGTKEHIHQQEQRIERLIARGHNIDDAEDFLSTLTNVLRAFERQRLLILDRLRA
jgi:hypothetical protein